MTCKEAQGLIMSYINDKLDNEELEQFLNHIESCSDCKEELEVYFTLLTGMKQLDEDKNLSGNFHIDFEKSLHKSEERIRKAKLNYVRKRMIYIIVCFVFCIMVNTNTDSQTNLDTPEEVEETSTYYMKYYYFRDKETPLKRVVDTQYEDMMQFAIKYQTEHLMELEQGEEQDQETLNRDK